MSSNNATTAFSSNALLTFHSRGLKTASRFHQKVLDRLNRHIPLNTFDASGKAPDENKGRLHTFYGPKIYLGAIPDRRNICDNWQHFNIERLRRFYRDKIHDSDDVTPAKQLAFCRGLEWFSQIKRPHLQPRRVVVDEFKCVMRPEVDVEATSRPEANFDPYECDFQISTTTPPLICHSHNGNFPSFRLLYVDLIDAVNRVIFNFGGGGDSQGKLEYLKVACEHIDLFLAQPKISNEFVVDLLGDYQSLGLIHIDGTLDLKLGAVGNVTRVHAINNGIASAGWDMHVNVVKGSSVKLNKSFSSGNAHENAAVGAQSSIGWSFGPCGFLIPYHIGSLSLLSELNLVNYTTPLVGASSGALAIVASTVLPDFLTIADIVDEIALDAQRNGTRYRLDELVQSTFKHLPEDGFEHLNNRCGSVSIAWSSKKLFGFEAHLVDKFKDSVDLQQALRVSCNIPRFSSRENITFRGEVGYDGYFAASLADCGCVATSALRTIRVSPFALSYRRSKHCFRNDFLNPLVARRDDVAIYYLMLKSLIKRLLLRKLTLDQQGNLQEWFNQIDICIAVYEYLSSDRTSDDVACCGVRTRDGHRRNKCLSGTQEVSIDDLVKLGPKISNLFLKVFEAETLLTKSSSARYKGARSKNAAVDTLEHLENFITRPFGFSGSNWAVSTPYGIYQWLKAEKDFATNIQLPLHLRTIKEMLHVLLLPPMKLEYWFTEFPLLLPSSSNNVKRLNMALGSSHIGDTRHLFDVGRCDSYRWLLAEYVAFENWLTAFMAKHEKLCPSYSPRQPKSMPSAANSDDTSRLNNSTCTLNGAMALSSSDVAMARKQHVAIAEITTQVPNLQDHLLPFSNVQDTSTEILHTLFKRQNALVRRALVLNLVPPRFAHLLTLKHFWLLS